MSKNNNGQTPMELDNVNHFKNFKMFAPFQQHQAHFPVESYSISFVYDNISVRKSSLAALIMERANKPANHEFDTSKCVTIDPLTAGINAHTFTSHEVGNVILYDFADHRKYYSSHAAVLENFKLILSKDCLEANISTSVPLPFDEFLFFPALVNAEPPTDIKNIENGLGWCLWCPDLNAFLLTRFLHVLLLSLAYNYCLSPSPQRTSGKLRKTNPIVRTLARSCNVWSNGIYWNKVEVVVEVSEDNRSITVLVSNKKMTESHRVFNSVIKNNLSLKNQLCLCTGNECMIAPNARTLNVHTLYSIEDVAIGFLTKLDIKEPNNIRIEDIVGSKGPFFRIAPLVTKAL